MRQIMKGLLVLLVLGIAVSAHAQTLGTIAGTAKDATGAVLPGVSVEVASPALIEKVRNAVTDSSGQYADHQSACGDLQRDVFAAGILDRQA